MRILQLGKYRRRADEQEHRSEDGGERVLGRNGNVLQHALHGPQTGTAEQAAQLAKDLASSRVFSDERPGNGDHDQ
jgi:hypothetical protein